MANIHTPMKSTLTAILGCCFLVLFLFVGVTTSIENDTEQPLSSIRNQEACHIDADGSECSDAFTAHDDDFNIISDEEQGDDDEYEYEDDEYEDDEYEDDEYEDDEYEDDETLLESEERQLDLARGYDDYMELASSGTENSIFRYIAQYRAGIILARGYDEQEADDDMVESHLVSAFEMRPTRSDPLLELARYFRRRENYAKAFLYAKAGRNIPFPEDSAFQEGDDPSVFRFSYLYRADYAFGFLEAICAISSYIGQYEEGKRACEELLDAFEYGMFVPHDIVEQARENLKLYQSKMGNAASLGASSNSIVVPMDCTSIDKTYLINLDRRVERRERMEGILDRIHLPYERVRAVDGALDVTEEYLDYHNISPLAAYEENLDSPLSKGEIGCFMSHYNIWLDITKNGYNQSLVLEDDVSFSPHFHSILPSVLAEVEALNLDWDVILLGKRKVNMNQEEKVDGSEFLIRPSFSLWALAYLVSASGAAKLVEAEPLPKMVPADDYLHLLSGSPSDDSESFVHLFASNHTFHLFATRPSLAWPTHDYFSDGHVSDTSSHEEG